MTKREHQAAEYAAEMNQCLMRPVISRNHQLIGRFMQLARIGAGLGLREFAERIGWLPSEYCNLECGRLPLPNERELWEIEEAIRKGWEERNEQLRRAMPT